ncbi:MAG: polyprenyl synthetase family protein [Methanocella sp.]
MMQAEAERQTLQDLFSPVADGLAEVERLLHDLVAEGGGSWLGETVAALLDAGGKRLRPALVLFSAHTGDYRPERVVPGAAAMELLHLASLVHDDVIDDGLLRRGRPTVNSRWGPALAILTGDYLFGKALLALSGLPSPAAGLMGAAIGELVAGEVDQQFSRTEAPGLDRYLTCIGRKTAALMAACCRLGAGLAGASEPVVARLGEYGWWLGMTYQAVDDLLDVRGDPATLGKAVGMDASRGITTLPALLPLEEARGMVEGFSLQASSEVAGLKPDWLRRTLTDLAGFVLERGV